MEEILNLLIATLIGAAALYVITAIGLLAALIYVIKGCADEKTEG